MGDLQIVEQCLEPSLVDGSLLFGIAAVVLSLLLITQLVPRRVRFPILDPS